MTSKSFRANVTAASAASEPYRSDTAVRSGRRVARMVGACFLISNIVFILGAVVFLEPVLGAADVLGQVSANRTPIILGALLEILNAVAYLGIAVLMFPIFKRRYESLALGYVSFRILEFVMQILADLSPLALITLGDAAVGSSPAEAASFQATSALLLAQRAWAFQMISVTFGLGALLFYIMLYRSKLVPRFISVWGLVGAAVVLVNTLFDMFGLTLPNLGVIMLLNELFLALWLIVKGFDPSALVSETA